MTGTLDTWEQLRQHLDELAADDLLRVERVIDSPVGATVTIAGRQLVCMCSNDYLGLANDPAVKAAAIKAIGEWGVGAGASRLVSGTTALHVELQRQLAEFKGTADCIVVSTGWAANHLAIHALAGPGDMIACDKLDHASIIDAAITSGARVRTYGHGDTARLDAILSKHRSEHRRCLIVTDSVFSMDGDVAPLADLVAIKLRHAAQLLIDEAHATGVLGAQGHGAAEALGVEAGIDATVGTLSKAFGAMGGFIAGPRVLIDTIRNAGRPYVYSTALAPAICAAAIESLRIIRDEPDRRTRLAELSNHLRHRLAEAGIPAGAAPKAPSGLGVPNHPTTPIVPVIVGPAAAALTISRKLLDEGFLVPAIRPPTVPRGASRLRISLSCLHRIEDIDRLADALARALRERA